jgi:hypothetical protein
MPPTGGDKDAQAGPDPSPARGSINGGPSRAADPRRYGRAAIRALTVQEAIDRQRASTADLPYVLNAVFPWRRPTVGVGLTEGIGEIDVAAVFELYSATSSATRTVPVAGSRIVTTRHGVVLLPDLADGDTAAVDRLIVPGVRDETGIDARLGAWVGRARPDRRAAAPGSGRWRVQLRPGAA